MDGKEFDNLVRGIGTTASRRAAIAGLLAAALGAAGVGPATAKRAVREDVGAAACNDQGCLAGGVLCLSGFGADAACGSGGNACTVCAGTTPTCSPNADFTGGSCQAFLGCASTQCQLAGACVPLTDPRVCGRFANGTCQEGCGSGQVCTSPTDSAAPLINRACAANTCSATCTTGCCTGLSCNAGTSIGACGVGGQVCVDCIDTCGLTGNGCAVDPADGVRKCQCQFLPPVEQCGPTTCPTGCCLNGVCQTGSAKDACGTGGAACSVCSGKKKCNASSRTCRKRR